VAALAFAVPGNLDQPTGGYAYDRRVIAELRRLGCAVDVIDLGDGFPRPTADAVREALARLQRVPANRPILIDGLALGVLPAAAQALRATHKAVALVHHPLALESGLTAAAAAVLRASERAALEAVRHVIVTSAATARVLVADYGVATTDITVAMPGNDPVAAVPKQAHGNMKQTVKLLAVGAVVRRKGYDVLLDALARLTDLDWDLVIAGDCTRNREVAGDLATKLVLLRFGSRARMTGAISDQELAGLYDSADLFVLASRHEGYGMAFTEAIAHGLPVVGTRAGAIPETVPDGAGILVPPDDVAALAAALRSMITDADLRARCAAVARRAAALLPTWDATARAILGAVRAVT
jgi:glycosyltransferase involved in cell wall biosynthesis